MNELTVNELTEIKGGMSGWGIAGILASAILGIGIFDGYLRPLECNRKG